MLSVKKRVAHDSTQQALQPGQSNKQTDGAVDEALLNSATKQPKTWDIVATAVLSAVLLAMAVYFMQLGFRHTSAACPASSATGLALVDIGLGVIFLTAVVFSVTCLTTSPDGVFAIALLVGWGTLVVGLAANLSYGTYLAFNNGLWSKMKTASSASELCDPALYRPTARALIGLWAVVALLAVTGCATFCSSLCCDEPSRGGADRLRSLSRRWGIGKAQRGLPTEGRSKEHSSADNKSEHEPLVSSSSV